MSGPTIYASNGKEQFTLGNPAQTEVVSPVEVQKVIDPVMVQDIIDPIVVDSIINPVPIQPITGDVNVVNEPTVITRDSEVAPVLVGSLLPSAFPNTTAQTVNLANGITRTAKRRAFFFVNTLNQTVTINFAVLSDSTLSGGHAIDGSKMSTITVPANTIFTVNGNSAVALNAPCNQISLNLQVATVPTTGKLDVYVTEIQ